MKKEDAMTQQHHRRKTESGRGGSMRRISFFMTCLAAVCVLLPYTVSYGDTNSTFTLVNRTSYYIHAHVGSTSYAFIGPGRSIVQKVGAPESVVAEVTYAPGQGVHGKATRTFDIMAVTSHTNSTDCSSTNRGNDCSNSIDASTTVYPARWDVTADDLATGGEGE
jgi:polygalacturonase